MKEELLKGLTEEQITKVKACKSQEEVLRIAKEEGIELTDEQLEAVSGGCGVETWPNVVCANCHQSGCVQVEIVIEAQRFHCKRCGHTWYGS